MIKSTQVNGVCVYCGADEKLPDQYKQLAFDLGMSLAEHRLPLVTGGNNVGLMRQVIDGHQQISPKIDTYAVIPIIFKEFGLEHPLIPDANIYWVEDVHARLRTFYNLSQDVIVLPGGFGTMHELIDCLVQSQFGVIQKRIFLLNIDGFWDYLLKQFEVMVAKNALAQVHFDHLIVINSLPELIMRINSSERNILEQGFASRYWETNNQSLRSKI